MGLLKPVYNTRFNNIKEPISEATICPDCNSANVLTEESDESTENTCLNCNHFFITDDE